MPAKYERIVADIRQQIRDGRLKPGDKLPSIAQLKQQYGVSYGPVHMATTILKAEGLVYGQPGEGVYVR